MSELRRWAWAAARRAHHADFRWLLPALARLPLPLGHALARARGEVNALAGRDWRSMGLGFRHIHRQALAGYREMGLTQDEATLALWRRQRFVAEARDEFEAQLIAARRVDELKCELRPSAAALDVLHRRERGLVLLTPHFESFFLGVAFLARTGAKINLMTSAVTHDPRVDPAVRQHFTAKYRGLERYLNGGELVDLELGSRQFYRMLQRREILVILGDAPVLPDGAGMEVDFLGARRRLAGGPLRMARATGSDLGGYVCRHLGGERYELELGPLGAAEDPATVRDVYGFFSRAITANPGGWWASDLLPAMPRVLEAAPPEAPSPARAVLFDTLLLVDSPLEGSGELALGLRQLRAALRPQAAAWEERTAASAKPADVLGAARAKHLLVLLEPSLLAASDLVARLAEALQAGGAACALAADPRDASGEWGVTYTSRGDFERYVQRRAALPANAPAPAHAPLAYLVDVDAARALLAQQPALDWAQLPRAFGARTVLAPRAFVHSYADYQQGDRAEMLELLPEDVQTLADIGGGEGAFARAFLRQRGGAAWLVEPSAAADRAQRVPGLHVLRGRAQDLDPALHGRFDAVTLLDVLEHLEEPLSLLQAAAGLLKPGGHLLVSVPNVGHMSIVRDLLQGRFDYAPVGVLCATHLRFFTRASLQQLLQEAGFVPVRWRPRGPQPRPELQRLADAARQAGLPVDTESLAAESLHVLARRR